jgi:hypothetical protein
MFFITINISSKSCREKQSTRFILVHKFQQDAQVTEFILSDNCCTCFGRHYHPSSGAQNNNMGDSDARNK